MFQLYHYLIIISEIDNLYFYDQILFDLVTIMQQWNREAFVHIKESSKIKILFLFSFSVSYMENSFYL